jgi:hypothetical protein
MCLQVKYQDLKISNLYRNAFYLTDRTNQIENGDDPLSVIFDCGDNGVFRYVGGEKLDPVRIAILCYKKYEPDFPKDVEECLALEFIKECFKNTSNGNRSKVPPFFVFTSGLSGPKGLDLLFRGVAVPGDQNVPVDRETHIVWSSKKVKEYLNQKVKFTVLDINEVKREWIWDLRNNNPLSGNCPEPWRIWVKTGECIPHKESKAKRYLRYILGVKGDNVYRD